jgi:RNA 2',3'-cyclic 3'-phosphodiesterase
LRVFIAIEFDKSIKEYLFTKQMHLKEYAAKGNFTIQENFHLTLNFIGESSPQQIEKLKEVIDTAIVNVLPFKLVLDKPGQFSKGNTKIIWVGTKKSNELDSMYGDLSKSLEQYGFKKDERGLSPHITLGREVVLKADFAEIIKAIHLTPEEISVDKLSLMESARVNGILKYIPIYTKAF